MKGMLQYVHGDTILHRMPPLIKLLIAIAICAACFATSNLLVLAALIAFDVALGYIGGIGKRTLKTLLSLCKFTSFIFILQIFFVPNGNTLLQLPFGIRVTDEGLRFSAMICMRLIGATIPLTVVLTLTRLPDLTRALVDKLHVPYKYAFSFTTAIRFIPILARDMAAVMEAQTARGVELDGNLFKKLRLLLPLCVPLLVSSIRKIESGAVSAELRGFHLRGAKPAPQRALKTTD